MNTFTHNYNYTTRKSGKLNQFLPTFLCQRYHTPTLVDKLVSGATLSYNTALPTTNLCDYMLQVHTIL